MTTREPRTSSSSLAVQPVPRGTAAESARSATGVALWAGARRRAELGADVVLVREERPVAAFAPAPVPRAARGVGDGAGSVPAAVPVVCRDSAGEAVVLVVFRAGAATASLAIGAFFATVSAFAVVGADPGLPAAGLGHESSSLCRRSRSCRHS